MHQTWGQNVTDNLVQSDPNKHLFADDNTGLWSIAHVQIPT